MKKIMFYLSAATIVLSSCGSGEPKTGAPNADSTASGSAATDTTIKLKEDNISYTVDTSTVLAYVAYNENSTAKRPAVIVVPEWWGLNEYPKKRARQLAELGYVAIAVDFYGNGKVGANPEEAMKLAGPFYGNPALVKSRIDGAIAKLKEYSQVDTSQIAAIGYCFGGSMVLTAAKLGENLKGVVSFHGGLAGIPPQKGLTKANVLVLHGEADSFVPRAEVDQFKKSMDSVGAAFTFKSYPNATHAFTNPEADENNKKFKMPIAYNPGADTASWNDMKVFLKMVFK